MFEINDDAPENPSRTDKEIFDECLFVLTSVAELHRIGFGGLRVFPIVENERWVLYIGPRLLFSAYDGCFVPPELRYRCARYVLGMGVPFSFHPHITMEILYSQRFSDDFNSDREATDFERGQLALLMEHCRLEDVDYHHWLITVIGMMSFSNVNFFSKFTLPYKHEDVEGGKLGVGIFRVSQYAIRLHKEFSSLPVVPSGTAAASSRSPVADLSIRVAQKRDKDAPNLFWDLTREKDVELEDDSNQ